MNEDPNSTLPPRGPLTYEAVRGHIKTGDLLAWSHRAWGSWYDLQVQAVRFFTQSEYCHVGVAYTYLDRVLVFEAVGAGVRIFPLSRLVPFYFAPLGLSWNDAAEAFAWSTLGKGYSKWQAIEAHLGVLHAEDDDLWQCAEFAQAIYKRLGLVMNCKPTPTQIVLAAQDFGAAVRHVSA